MGRFCSYFLSSIKLDKTSENRKKKDSRENRSNVNKQNSSCIPSEKVVLQMSFAEKMFVQRVCLGTVVFVLFVFFARLIILTRVHILSKINCHGFFGNTLKSHRNFFRE